MLEPSATYTSAPPSLPLPLSITSSHPPHPPLKPKRIHALDNLRALLTVLLTFHHAVYRISPAQQDLLAIFHLLMRAVLWSLFFFVSGRAAGVALAREGGQVGEEGEGKGDYRFFVSRVVKTALPACGYALVLRPILIAFLERVWKDVFARPGMSILLSGPAAYTLILITFDFLLLSYRFAERRYPALVPSKLFNRLQPTSEAHFTRIVAQVLALLVVWRFIHSSLNQTDLRILHLHILDTNDEPGADAPLSYLIAYLLGVNFDKFKKHLTLPLPSAYLTLLISLVSAYVTMWLYLSIIIWHFPGLRFRLTVHNLLFAFWDTYLLYTLPIPLISIFSSAPWARRDWGVWARHTRVQVYVDMVPVLLVLEWCGWIRNRALRAGVVGFGAVLMSWGGMLVWVALKSGVGRLGRRLKLNRVVNGLRKWTTR